MENDGRKLGIFSIVFCELSIVGLILGLIGIVRGIKAKSKLSILLNIIGIVLSIAILTYTIVTLVGFINGIKSIITQ